MEINTQEQEIYMADDSHAGQPEEQDSGSNVEAGEKMDVDSVTL
jgi:hypothetical protein